MLYEYRFRIAHNTIQDPPRWITFHCSAPCLYSGARGAFEKQYPNHHILNWESQSGSLIAEEVAA